MSRERLRYLEALVRTLIISLIRVSFLVYIFLHYFWFSGVMMPFILYEQLEISEEFVFVMEIGSDLVPFCLMHLPDACRLFTERQYEWLRSINKRFLLLTMEE